MTKKIVVLPGDGIGPEVIAEAVQVIEVLRAEFGFAAELEYASVGGAAYDAHGHPLPETTLALCRVADAIVLGAVGGPRYDKVSRELRPEKALLSLRSELELFANLRPAVLYPQLTEASSLKAELVSGLDILIVRELTGGIYFGKPRGIQQTVAYGREGFNTLRYNEYEIRRIAKVAFEAARKRNGRVCSVDKANVLEVSELWREVVSAMAFEYPDIRLSHMYVDNAAMQLVKFPKQFDVILTTNMFGDILSDIAAMLTGSIGMLPSASLNAVGKGMYEPIHGSAPDIAGRNLANPLATILSVAMMLRYSFDLDNLALKVESAVGKVLQRNLRTTDIALHGIQPVGTREMGEAVVAALKDLT